MNTKAKSRQEIAEEYGISPRTLSRWLQKAELEVPSGLVSPKFQEVIYEKFGRPKF